MYQDPRGGQGPAFRGTRRPSHVRRSSLEEIERTTSRSTARSMDGRSIRRLSHFQHHPRQHDHAVTPLHDPAGKPLRRHGTETIGDVLLHPFKELKLHHQREEAYELERREWNEKHPESAASINDVENLNEESIIDDVQVRIVVHFRHLVGDQDIEFTDEKLQELKEPLELTEGEMATIKRFHEMDEFIDFLEKTKRTFSVKIHKTVDLKKLHDSSRDSSSLDLREKVHNIIHHDDEATRSIESPPTESTAGDNKSANEKAEKPTISTEGAKPTITTTSPTTPAVVVPQKQLSSNHLTVPDGSKESENPEDIFIELNENIYLQIEYIKHTLEHTPKQRRALFIVPDPDLSDEIGEESSATWVELLGDVFYVGWLSNFTGATHITSSTLMGKYVAWFVVMWWTWCSSALYSSRYDSGDVVHHIYKIIELCGLIIMAGSSPTYDTSPKWFIIGYIIMKAVILVQYAVIFSVSLGTHFKSSRRPLGAYVAASAISIIMWGVSLLYISPEDMAKRYVLWYLSIGLELLVHLFLQTNSRVSLAASHLGERFGLFTLIVLGENCMGFIETVAESVGLSEASNPVPSVMAATMFSVAIIFCYFFMYFDDFSGEFVAKTKMSSLWMYLHFPLHLVQVAFGTALTTLIDILAERMKKTETVEVTSHLARLSAEASEASSSSSESGHEISETFVIRFFWVTAGLILCFNAFIKLVNTPVKGAHHRSHIICASRFLNAIIFFALSATTFDNLDPLSMISIMMACLLFQSAVDLLD
ncbi:hypothetical protein G6F37_005372 [Rhizopus arrhizus]|nr:hypothetical protein G6F38_002288 [Rhizopus arrhizus]KAG1158908.1 hypothetical protein G6F37_005372 [Rhizopus arrhizus]